MEAAAPSDAISSLGQELKQWEKTFAACNAGKRPSRQDIKQDAIIAAKYKEYQALRDTHNTSFQSLKKRKRDHHEQSAFNDDSTTVHTPRKSRNTKSSKFHEHIDADNDNNESLPPSVAFIGPTPQKDGLVMGLFDRLPGSTTPAHPARAALDTLDENAIVATPTKSTLLNQHPDAQFAEATALEALTPSIRHRRTPQSSSGKRFLLDKFVTPSKRRRDAYDQTPQPQQQSNADSTTPSFLRRPFTALPQLAENPNSPATKRQVARSTGSSFKRKSITRSLSTMIAEMRAAEEAKLDEEMELLREMEGETNSPRQRPAKAENTPAEPAPASVLVQDSQMPALPRADGESDSEHEEGEAQKATSSRPWKKKGQKRQTRRVTIKPAAPKTGKIAGASLVDEASDDDAETASHDVQDSEEQADELDHSASPTKRRKTANTTSDPTSTTDATANSAGNVLRKTARKISATAHANFRRLKIKSSKGAKAAAAGARGGRGRFGRSKR